ncbi:uncharacterized protein [Haliotis cracherodii]|uniref:uncharacterized protein n=1 Tax=Haliotis cracherodii TaxID=6455 RepID=UPI0039E736CC
MSYVQVQPRCYRGQDWILPHKVLVAILSLSLILLLLGIILLAVGISSVGGVFVGLGGCGLMVLLLLCIHAYCCRYSQDVYTQTWMGGEVDVEEIPSYAVIQKPSSLKRSDSGSKRNGRTLEKHVTLSPDTELREGSGHVTIAPSGGSPRMDTVHQIPIQHSSQSHMYSQQNSYAGQTPIYKPSGPGYVPPMQHPLGPPFAPPSPTPQYPIQVYPMRGTSSTSSSIRYGFDDDYDNPAESTPMLSTHTGTSSSSSYHTQIRSSSSSQQSSAIHTKGGARAEDIDIPEPQPLVYPSAKRPMTFEQTSSSKMSVYDNVLSAYPEESAA